MAEHYHRKLNGLKLSRDAQYNAQTDGVCFMHVFVDKNAGPRQQDVVLVAPTDTRYENLRAEGYELDEEGMLVLPLSENGDIQEVGTTVREFSEGDIATRVVLAHEVFFDAEAKTVNGPYDQARWCIIRRVRDLEAARLETGNAKLEAEGTATLTDPVLDASDVSTQVAGYQRGLPPYPMSRQRRSSGVFDFLIYIAPNEAAGIPDGLWRRVIGQKLIGKGNELPGHKIPLARMTDGSSDTEMFPVPYMSTWLPDQLSINAITSKLIEHVRIFGTGRVMAQKGTIVTESYTSIVGSLLEFTGMKPEFLNGQRVSGDVWNSLEFFIKKLEDKTGWNDLGRGQMSGSGSLADVSGRALLGARELFERQFGPMITSTAEGMSEWATLIVDYARWLFDTARLIPITGRGDLAKRIKSKDLGEETVVYVDPETMMPLPRALRNQMLFDLLEKGLIDTQTYQERSPFAEIRNVNMGGTEQWERAQLVNTILEDRYEELAQLQDPMMRTFPEEGGISILWQDDPEAHKNSLIQIALDERKPQVLRDIASERWGMYDMLERAKTPNPETGQPLVPPPPFVRGVPPDLAPTPNAPAPEPEISGGVPGGGAGPQASPAPGLSPIATPAASNIEAPALGEFGAVEQNVQDLQQG